MSDGRVLSIEGVGEAVVVNDGEYVMLRTTALNGQKVGLLFPREFVAQAIAALAEPSREGDFHTAMGQHTH
jgi:hypothetical protein